MATHGNCTFRYRSCSALPPKYLPTKNQLVKPFYVRRHKEATPLIKIDTLLDGNLTSPPQAYRSPSILATCSVLKCTKCSRTHSWTGEAGDQKGIPAGPLAGPAILHSQLLRQQTQQANLQVYGILYIPIIIELCRLGAGLRDFKLPRHTPFWSSVTPSCMT